MNRVSRGAPSDDRLSNNLLRALRPDDFALLEPHLEEIERTSTTLLYNPGDNVEYVYFPCGASLISYLVSNEDGREVETILVGREGAVGGIVSLGHLPAYCRITVKHPGRFLKLSVSNLEAAKAKSPALTRLFARYADCLLAQIFQSTACNAIHSIERRTAKWILSAMERTGDERVPLTHEELASMLGVGRSYTSRVLQAFRMEGLLQTHRGALVVMNFDALKERACLCNESVKQHFDTVLTGVYPADPA
jgi:CRP-like cAMP-binding protein